MTPRTLGTFRLDDLWFGIDVARIQEVLPCRPLTRVPLAPGAVAGLLNLRGRVIPVLDLRRRLDMLPFPRDARPMILVLPGPESPVGLRVDDVGEVVEVPEEGLTELPGMLQGTARELIAGACRLPGRILHLLDLDRVLDIESASSASPKGRP